MGGPAWITHIGLSNPSLLSDPSFPQGPGRPVRHHKTRAAVPQGASVGPPGRDSCARLQAPQPPPRSLVSGASVGPPGNAFLRSHPGTPTPLKELVDLKDGYVIRIVHLRTLVRPSTHPPPLRRSRIHLSPATDLSPRPALPCPAPPYPPRPAPPPPAPRSSRWPSRGARHWAGGPSTSLTPCKARARCARSSPHLAPI